MEVDRMPITYVGYSLINPNDKNKHEELSFLPCQNETVEIIFIEEEKEETSIFHTSFFSQYSERESIK